MICATTRDSEAGGRAFRTSKAMLEQLEREDPDNHKFPNGLAILYGNYMILLDNTGQDSSEAGDQQLAYLERAAALRPRSLDAALHLGMAQQNRALAYMRKRDWQRAAVLLDKSIAWLEGLLETHPRHPGLRLVLANAVSHRSLAHQRTGAMQEGARLARRAIAMYDDLLDESPTRPEYALRYAVAVNALVETRTQAKDEEKRMLRRARRRLRHALRRSPGNTQCKEMLARVEQLLRD